VVIKQRPQRGETNVRDGYDEVAVQQGVDVFALRRLQNGSEQGLPQNHALQAHGDEETRERAEQPRHGGFPRGAPRFQTLVRALVHEQDHDAPFGLGERGMDREGQGQR
jgi:hypothetical protein|tara:strand:+ start:2492 stop:2818 length:327 start_codon:yes stop_codon:yes gene_type:complete